MKRGFDSALSAMQESCNCRDGQIDVKKQDNNFALQAGQPVHGRRDLAELDRVVISLGRGLRP